MADKKIRQTSTFKSAVADGRNSLAKSQSSRGGEICLDLILFSTRHGLMGGASTGVFDRSHSYELPATFPAKKKYCLPL